MRAAVYRGRGMLSIEDVPRPADPASDEVQIRVTRVAVCGTDSAEWDHGPVLAVPPVILGHEFTGEVVAIGSAVTGLQNGNRVVSGAGVSCGQALLEGEYGIKSYFMGVPVQIGAGGVEKVLEMDLTPEERAEMEKSFQSVKKTVDSVKL